MPTVESERVELMVEVKRITERAVELYDGKTTAWFPRSLVRRKGTKYVTMPDWLAQEKGFV